MKKTGSETPCSPIKPPSNANAMRLFTMMARLIQIGLFTFLGTRKEAGYFGNSQYLSWGNLSKEHHFRCYRDTGEDHRGSRKKRRLSDTSLWYWPNLSIDLAVDISKCFLLGRLNMTTTTYFNWNLMAYKITSRSPQMETLMLPLFISASLWGCFACELFSRHFSSQKHSLSMSMTFTKPNASICHQHYPNTGTDLTS